ncbi:hypothetical protein GCM10007916_34600 [Psychromonas marina]|uniref:DUF2237 domain-containing protein n=1 Tax=Psychromonas marina TaxID=88364 RepID=A0ABQ6E4Q3_9GAMM|nr:DUF2237 domain-containing protein [Psychromonas marina]GLS92389.1 hypothetical protein GCM10007916_34600 [Psychromonas marina]
MEMDKSLNVFGETLELCCNDPITGAYRDGKCNTSKLDVGSHTVCIKVTKEFLEYSTSKGNDLSTPVPEYQFKGLKPGNSWCLCASRWLEAEKDNMAPRIHLTRTHIKALDIVPMELLKKYAVDLN